MAAYGAKSDGGKDPQAGLAYLRELITKHVKVQDKSGREALQDFTSGNGDVLHLLRERGDHGPEEGPAGRLRHPRQDDPDREPDRGRLEVQAPRRRRRRSSTTRCRPPAQQKFADWGYRPVDRVGARRRTPQVPDAAAGCSPSATWATGARSTTSSSIPTRARWPRSRKPRGSPLPSEALTARRRPPLSRAAAGGTGALGLGVATLWLSVIVLIPLAALVAALDRRRPGHLLVGGLEPAGGGGAEAVAVDVAGRRGGQRGGRHGDRVGARARRVPRQGGAQRAHRPALRAAHHRRRDHPARPGRADVARGHPRGRRRRGRS